MAAALLTAAASGSQAAAQTADAGFRPLVIDGRPVKWLGGAGGGRVTLRYRIADGAVEQPEAVNCRRMRSPHGLLAHSGLSAEVFRAALDQAFRRWQDVADIAFVEAAKGEAAEIVVGEQSEPEGFAFTNVTLGDGAAEGRQAVRPIVGASICLNPERRWKIGFDGNLAVYDLLHTLTHEIGHVIGLDHPNGQGALMSFRYTETEAGLREGDVLGAMALYGASRSLVAGSAAPAVTTGTLPGETTSVGRGMAAGAAR